MTVHLALTLFLCALHATPSVVRAEIAAIPTMREASAWGSLPDGGPRTEPNVTTIEATVLEPSQALLREGRYEAALWALGRIEEQGPASGLAPMARAYRAEAMYRQQAGSQFRFEVIDVYRSLIHDFPQSVNAARASWRIGDLYAEQGWLVEAQAAYERAARDAVRPQDKERAFLGLAIMQVEGGRWRAAVETLKGLRNADLDDLTRSWVSFALAEGFYGLQRFDEAAELYRQVWQRWPDRLRQSPEALLHLVEIERRQGHEEAARRVRLMFYNLYPRHREAAGTLVALGDSLRRGGLTSQAELMYGLTVQWHGNTETGHLARLRLAELGQELLKREPRHPLVLEVAAKFQDGLRVPLAPVGQRAVFESLSKAHPDKALASEALFRLAEHYVETGDPDAAEVALRRACEREGRVAGDVWPRRARQQLAALLRPALASAIREADDFQAVQVFHRYGSCPDWKSGHLDLVLHLAEAHRRLGFSEPAVRLYQHVLRDSQAPDLREYSLIGLGRTYLDQRDGPAARAVFERYQLEYPLGSFKGDALKYLSESWALMGDAGAVIKTTQRWFKWQSQRASNDPSYGHMLVRLAGAQAATGRYADAIRTVRKAERAGVMPYAQARLREGRYRDASGEGPAAIAHWAEVVRTEPRSIEASLARLHMARAWWRQRRWMEAEIVLGKIEQTGVGDVLARAATVLKAAVEIQRKAAKEEQP